MNEETYLDLVCIQDEEVAYLAVSYRCPCCGERNTFPRTVSSHQVRGSTFTCDECGQMLTCDVTGEVFNRFRIVI